MDLVSENTESEEDVIKTTENGHSALKCPSCEFQATTAYRLKSHILQFHPEETINGQIRFT